VELDRELSAPPSIEPGEKAVKMVIVLEVDTTLGGSTEFIEFAVKHSELAIEVARIRKLEKSHRAATVHSPNAVLE